MHKTKEFIKLIRDGKMALANMIFGEILANKQNEYLAQRKVELGKNIYESTKEYWGIKQSLASGEKLIAVGEKLSITILDLFDNRLTLQQAYRKLDTMGAYAITISKAEYDKFLKNKK